MVALSLQKAGMLLKFTPFCYFDYIVPLNVYLRLCEIIYCLKDGRLNICVRGIPKYVWPWCCPVFMCNDVLLY